MKSRAERRATRERREAGAVIREAKLFMNGRSQAVRLPADCRFDGESVYVKKWRGAVVLLPIDDPWRPLLDSLGAFSDDFMAEREQGAMQSRAELDGAFEA